MASNKFKLGLCQFLVGDDKDINLRTAAKAITDASEQGADIIVLPEIFNSPYATASFPVYCEAVPELYTIAAQIDVDKSPSSYMLSNAAKTHKKYIIGGSIPEETYENDTRKLYNTCLVFDTDGNVIGKYRKMHLFDINIPNKMVFYESETLSAGSDLCMVNIEGVTKNAFKIGIAICYDIRFSELAEIYRQNNCSLLVYPAAFNTTTGPLHWRLLQRARATDNQLFVASCSPARNHHSKGYPVYGHSIITDPWGQVLNELDENTNILVQEIDLDSVDQVRASIPIWKQKRYDMYSSIKSKL
eukprot:CAMPEP_0202701160 /NCGR_PEP_ID=MMETSP1385-20130828/14271_1 /ASSEMBLY_ACC=CAM_ASM_000861 /TAXON_ID=933848 /ORGANISM="Elphidium margaritaceum" /LENGTH=301 /DNA_ID=CAMNT_0049358515 /DNA_START=119 /DNA_END=1024 /DNA_ORIENTATION=-